MTPALRLAVWSGPRNISTAMLRSWGNRSDTMVVDEPFYAHYLARTGLQHPGRADILASQPNDWCDVATTLLADLPAGKSIFYQKMMAHHLFDDMYGDWLQQLTHVFLLRRPDAMLVSLQKVIPAPGLTDTGLPQQLKLYQHIHHSTGVMPLVIDAADLLAQPEPMLRRWCELLDISFSADMLQWPPGRRHSDGVWAEHWYASVEASTGFQQAPALRPVQLTAELQSVYDQCLEYYQPLHQLRLRLPEQ